MDGTSTAKKEVIHRLGKNKKKKTVANFIATAIFLFYEEIDICSFGPEVACFLMGPHADVYSVPFNWL